MSAPRSTPRSEARALARVLADANIRAWETGEALRMDLEDTSTSPAAGSHGFEMTAQCRLDDFLRTVPSAIPVRPDESIALAPSRRLPIEVRCIGSQRLESHLAARDFTVHAIARDPLDGSLVDPFDGIQHLEARALKATPACVGSLARRRGVRAARLVAQGYVLAPDLHKQLEQNPGALVPRPRECAAELGPLLMADDAQRGIDLLESTGLLSRLLGRDRKAASAPLGALPRKLPLRLAALIGSGATRVARKLGFSRSTLEAIERLHRNHPLDLRLDPRRHSNVRRLAKALEPGELEDLIALREAECCALPESEARVIGLQLASVRKAVERARSESTEPEVQLALGGQEVMSMLGCGPGPQVGQALAWLREAVRLDPEVNSREKLRTLLERRSSEASSGTSSSKPE